MLTDREPSGRYVVRPRLKAAVVLALLFTFFPPTAGVAERGEALETALRRLLGSPALAGTRVGFHAISLADGRVLFSHNADLPLAPASNMKVLTTAAALWALKPDFRFRTAFLADGRLAGGVLEGNLYVRGSGAPDLVCENLWAMARELHARGLTRVRGSLVGDASRFDAQGRVEDWKGRDSTRAFAAPVGALSCNFNTLNVLCQPGEVAGAPLRVVLDPFRRFFDLRNEGVTRGGRATLVVDRRYENGRNVVAVGGSLPPGGGDSFTLCSVEDPAGYFLSSFIEVAEQVGITFEGPPRTGAVPPATRELYAFESQPLGQLLVEMNKHSTNFIAEMVLKALGAEVLGPPGSTERGLEVVRLYLEPLGVPLEGVALRDGSGLSRFNRLTARLLAAVVRQAWRDFESGPEFVSSLPIAGADGTLERRMRESGVMRRVRAKTGYISGASTLTGVASNPTEGPIAFSILMNAVRGGNGQERYFQDRICTALVNLSPADRPPAAGSR